MDSKSWGEKTMLVPVMFRSEGKFICTSGQYKNNRLILTRVDPVIIRCKLKFCPKIVHSVLFIRSPEFSNERCSNVGVVPLCEQLAIMWIGLSVMYIQCLSICLKQKGFVLLMNFVQESGSCLPKNNCASHVSVLLVVNRVGQRTISEWMHFSNSVDVSVVVSFVVLEIRKIFLVLYETNLWICFQNTGSECKM